MSTKAVIFDLDGTLTVPLLDFDQIRRETGVESGPLLETLQAMPPWRRAVVESILIHHELAAARASQLNPGVKSVTAALSAAGIKQAVLTRNCRRSTNITLQRHGLKFDAVITRENEPVKPSPQPVLDLCKAMLVKPHETIVVGDYLFDIESGKAAGARTVLLCHNSSVPHYADLADHVIHNLKQLLDLL